MNSINVNVGMVVRLNIMGAIDEFREIDDLLVEIRVA